MEFVNLHNHTEYSLLDGFCRMDDFCKRASQLGQKSIAITDHGYMYGNIEFYKSCKRHSLKPIFGIEAYISPGRRDQKSGNLSNAYYHVLMFAKDQEGYRNLMKIASVASIEGFFYRPRADRETLAKYARGIVATSGCLRGEIPCALARGEWENAKNIARDYIDIFGKENFFVELMYHGIEDQVDINAQLIKLAAEMDLPLVVTNDTHYVNRGDVAPHDVLLCIQTGKTLDNPSRMKFGSDQFYLKSGSEISEVWGQYPEAIKNTLMIAEMCNVELDLGHYHLPKFPIDEDKYWGHDEKSLLEHLCREALPLKYGDNPDESIVKRFQYELEVINNAGFAAYFLIVWDFIKFANDSGIPVGPGRGSAAGSIVAYLLNITRLDPIEHGLIFERFLNPGRKEMPDIDTDFCVDRRGEVIEYVRNKYGDDRVSQIVTFGRLKAKNAIRDVGRVMDYPLNFVDQIAKAIPAGPMWSLDKALELSPDFAKIYKENPDAKKIIDLAKQLEGFPRNASTHAAGVIIASDSLTNFAPLQKMPKTGDIVTQFEMTGASDIGLLKMDFLGLRNLTVMKLCNDFIAERHGKGVDIDSLTLDDPKVYELLQSGDTTGVFQLECLTGDTVVSGCTIKSMYESQSRTKTKSVYLDKGCVADNQIVRIVESGVKDVFRISTSNGMSIMASENHKFMSDRGWVVLSGLSAGDRLLVSAKTSSGKHKRRVGRKVKSDGFRSDINHRVDSASDADFARTLLLHDLKYAYKEMTFEFKMNGSVVKYTPGFYVPSQNTFYDVMDASSNETYKVDILRAKRPDVKIIIIDTTRLSEHLMKYAIKHKDLVQWESVTIPDGMTWARIESIEHCGQDVTYDIEMRSPGNNYIANGFVVHNSAGMRRYLKQLKPDRFNDISAMVALYRPGPIQGGMVDRYIERRHGREAVEYPHESLRDVLASTYGVIVFQEQVMFIANVMGGYTMTEADELRKAMGKKKFDLMAKHHEKFVIGAVANGFERDLAEHVWSLMETFAGYGFNLAHAAAYGLVTYQTAWLKAHYPSEFMCALMASVMDKIDKVSFFISEARSSGITVLPPDINESNASFRVTDDGIRFGMAAIRHVGHDHIKAIIRAREKGPFRSLYDFCMRVEASAINRRVVESLIKAGAFDRIGGARATLLGNVEAVLSVSGRNKKDIRTGQGLLFDIEDDRDDDEGFHMLTVQEFNKRQRLMLEKEVLGLYLSDSPLSDYESLISDPVFISIGSLPGVEPGSVVMTAGVVAEARKIITKTKKNMAFVQLDGPSGSCEVVVFPSAYDQYEGLVQEDRIIVVKGKVETQSSGSRDDDEEEHADKIKLLADAIFDIDKFTIQDAREAMGNVGKAEFKPKKKERYVPMPKTVVVRSDELAELQDSGSDDLEWDWNVFCSHNNFKDGTCMKDENNNGMHIVMRTETGVRPMQVRQIIEEHKGRTPVIVHIVTIIDGEKRETKILVNRLFYVDASQELMDKLEELLGFGSVWVDAAGDAARL